MLVSLKKDNALSKPLEIVIHVEISEIDDPLVLKYSHSFKYKSLGTNKGEIIIYNDKKAASGDKNGIPSPFDLQKCNSEECHKKYCKKENKACEKKLKDCKEYKCPVILSKENRLLVVDFFHAKPKAHALQVFGAALFKALFTGFAGKLLEKTKSTHPNVGVYLQLNDNDDLDAIPWEYANDRTILLVHQCKFARVHNRSQGPLPKRPLRIVAVVPDPISTDLADLHLGEQFRSFVDGFTQNKKAVRLERVFPPTVHQMDAQLMKEHETATVLHFMGHCGENGLDGPRALIFEQNGNGEQEYIDTSRLVKAPDNLCLAFLSACDSRDVARVLVERGVPYAIGSNCPIPNGLARKFELEFYKFLTGGCTVNRAMWQARVSLQNSNDLQYNYFAGAMVFYSSKFDEDDFQCEDGNPVIQLQEPKHNLTELTTVSSYREHKKELSKLYTDLKGIVYHGTRVPHIYTIRGVGGQEFVAEAMRRMSHLFPGGIFAWAFDRETTSAEEYFRRLVETIFPKGFWTQLIEEHGSNIQALGSAIINEFGARATCLLILHHVDILDIGKRERNVHAIELEAWLRRVPSEQIKILITASKPSDWCTDRMIDLNGSMEPEVYDKKSIHKYFAITKEPDQFYGVPIENLAFVERLDILARMETVLDSSGTPKILALSGLGGMGKTQSMLRYCYLHRAAYDYIFWLEVDTWLVAVESFRKLAIKLGIDKESTKGEDSEKKVIDWVHSWFHKKTKWLLLLDNADDEMDRKIFQLLPRIGGHVIFTTRMNIPPTKAAVIHVDKMREQEAIVLLYNVPSMDLVDQSSAKFHRAQKIITELDYMPLAIDLARAYINDTMTSFEKYLSMLKERKECTKLLEHGDKEDPDRYKYTVATVWNLSFEHIRALNPTAVQLLDAFTFFHPENIPVCIFETQHLVLKLATSETDNEQSCEAIRKAIVLLARFSFVTVTQTGTEEDPASGQLTIHRLVQKVVYDAMTNETKRLWIDKISNALHMETKFPSSDIYKPYVQKTITLYLLHIRRFTTLLEELDVKLVASENLGKLLTRVVCYLLNCQLYSGIEDLALIAVQVSESTPRLNQNHIMAALNNLAMLYDNQSKYKKALQLYKRVLEIGEKELGPEHFHIATPLNNLAMLYKRQGEFNEVELLYQRALAIREKNFGPENALTALPLSNLAEFYKSQGKYNKAEPLLQRALAIREKTLEPDHPETADSINNLAGIYIDQGQYGKCEQLYKKVLDIREKVLGLENTSTAMALNNLGKLYRIQGKYIEAEPLLLRALGICQKVLDKKHPDTAISLNSLAELYESQGKYGEAGQLHQQALAIREMVLGPTHPLTAKSLNNLAVVYKIQGKYEETETLYQRGLDIREKILGPDHPDTAESLNNLATLHDSQGKHSEAEKLQSRALKIRENILGADHPTTAESLNNLAIIYSNQGMNEKAEPLYDRALIIREKALGLEHPDTATSLDNLAILYISQSKLDKAELMSQRALAIREKALGPKHPDVATSLNTLAALRKSQANYSEAEQLFKQVLEFREKAFGSQHPLTTLTKDNLADLYKSQSDITGVPFVNVPFVNAPFAMEVTVSDPHRIGIGYGSYIVYKCVIKGKLGATIVVRKRYSDFVILQRQLVNLSYKMELPKLPPKIFLGNLTPDSMEKRRSKLEHFLSNVALHQEFGNSSAFTQWLTL